MVFWGPGGDSGGISGACGIIFENFFCDKKPVVVSITFRVWFLVGFGGALGAKIDGFWSQKPVRKQKRQLVKTFVFLL